jgi:nucleotide-binding universal stress UspA family protein
MYKEILLAVDLAHKKTQMRAVETACEYASKFGARLHVVTVVPDFGMSLVAGFFPADYEEKALAKANAELHAFVKKNVPESIAVQHVVGHGTAYREILRAAEETKCDLIIMASHRPEASDHLIGPNALKVVGHAGCSVLVVRG